MFRKTTNLIIQYDSSQDQLVVVLNGFEDNSVNLDVFDEFSVSVRKEAAFKPNSSLETKNLSMSDLSSEGLYYNA
ncbi:MAG: hypothetical protein ABI045_03270 [Flavobacteriales bacterium]